MLEGLYLYLTSISDFSPHYLHYFPLPCLLLVPIYRVFMVELFLSILNDGYGGFVS